MVQWNCSSRAFNSAWCLHQETSHFKEEEPHCTHLLGAGTYSTSLGSLSVLVRWGVLCCTLFVNIWWWQRTLLRGRALSLGYRVFGLNVSTPSNQVRYMNALTGWPSEYHIQGASLKNGVVRRSWVGSVFSSHVVPGQKSRLTSLPVLLTGATRANKCKPQGWYQEIGTKVRKNIMQPPGWFKPESLEWHLDAKSSRYLQGPALTPLFALVEHVPEMRLSSHQISNNTSTRFTER